MTDHTSKIVVGSEEWCAFPELGVPAIKARVDSGAKTSSIHAFNIQKFRRNGESWVSFEVHPLQHDRRTVIRCEKPVLDKRTVKSSSGIAETRYVIGTTMQVGHEIWDVEITLANRDSMGYRMLLGREAMSGRVLVDPALSFCLGDKTDKTLLDFYEKRKTSVVACASVCWQVIRSCTVINAFLKLVKSVAMKWCFLILSNAI